ncbi:MAG TPA: ATP-binding protein [Bryobacteraceae bacterium]|jgi:signal transduction histidine kinase|nr:ATP-binding protein [Bryobacteraceae bacterium]
MPEHTEALPRPAAGHFWRLQAQDVAWLIFVAALILTIPETNYNYTILVIVIGAFQIIEPRLTLFSSTRGQVVSVALKLLLSYLLVGWSHGVSSLYYSIFLIPVVSAAAIFELPGVVLVTAVACAAYFSFLLPVFIGDFQLPPDYLDVMGLRASFFAIIAFLVYQQAKAKRDQMRRTEEAAQRLAETNRELRETQASLRRSERLAALGQLTAGLAHELRNPLGTIRASAEMLHRRSAKTNPEVMDEMAANITSEVDRMNGLVTSFLDFARPLELHPAIAELRTVFEEVTREQADLAASRNVRLLTGGAEFVPAFAFDRNLLRVALSNLVQNALQASLPGQEVRLAAQQSNGEVNIFVRDSGEGIAREHLESIFNPFFTTKPKGVGLGLALVAKIVDEHGGRIHVSSERGKGTVFEVTLPFE